jgi:hypothetical protein
MITQLIDKCGPIPMVAFLPHQVASHGGSWKLDFCRSFLHEFSMGLRNCLLQTNMDTSASAYFRGLPLRFTFNTEPVRNVPLSSLYKSERSKLLY